MSPLFVPMTKATGLGRLPDFLEQWAGAKSVPRAFQKAGLPMDIIEFIETKIPVEAIHSLFELSARASDNRCFGLTVGQDMTHTTFGLWMKYCTQGETLAIGLARIAQCALFQQTGGGIVFEPGLPISLWRYIPPPDLIPGQVQHCDHLIGPMIRFVQSYLGPDWRPEWVELAYPRDDLAHLLEAQLPFPLRFGTPALTLAIRHKDLSRRRSASLDTSQAITYVEVQASEDTGLSREPLISVFSAITLRLLDGQTDIQGAACALGVGVQTLQRNLRREGVDYRDLLNRAKCHRARALLSDTTLPVVDIAFSLGYTDHANFSRAFKRMVGLAPVAYRGLNLAARLDPHHPIGPARMACNS